MKTLKSITTLVWLVAGFLITGCEQKANQPEAAALPYPLDTCIVTGEKLDSDPDMKPYTFVYQGQEIKLCCKSCLKDFNKDPDTYLKKLEKLQQPAQTE